MQKSNQYSHNTVSMVQFAIQYHWSHKQINWQIVHPIMSQSQETRYSMLSYILFILVTNKVVLLHC